MVLTIQDIQAIARETARLQADQLLRDVDVARVLSIGKSTVWLYVKRGLIPKPVKFGTSSVWRMSEIQGVIHSLGGAA